MGKWTLAHTEALCSEKFHTALQKPLSQSGLKLEEFFDAFDPQDPVVQKLVGALVNDIVQRRKSTSRTPYPAGCVSERCAQASYYINHRSTDAHPHFPGVPPYRARSATIRARRRNEMYGVTGIPPISDMPWRTSYSSWSPDAEELIPDQPSPSSIPDPYRAVRSQLNQIESESSGEYWWRAAMQGHTVGSAGSLSASPTPFVDERSPSPNQPRSPRLPSNHGFVPWISGRPPRRPTTVVEPESSSGDPESVPPVPSAPFDTTASDETIHQEVDHEREREVQERPMISLRRESPLYTGPVIRDREALAIRSPDLGPYQPTNVEIFRFDQAPIWVQSPPPVAAGLASPQLGPTTVTVEDSLWR